MAFGQDFDEYFLNAFQFQQKLNQQQEEHLQDIKFKMRQLSLLDDYRNAVLGNQQYEFAEEKPLREAQTEYYKFRSQPKPEEQGLIKGSELIPMYEGKLEQNYEMDPITKEKRITGYGSLIRPYESTVHPKGTGTKEKEFKEKELSQKGIGSLNFLRNANQEIPSWFNKEINPFSTGEEDLKVKVDNAITGLSSELLSSETARYFQGLRGDKWKSPLELTKKIKADIDAGKVTEKMSNELQVMMNYYEQFYPGIKDTQ